MYRSLPSLRHALLSTVAATAFLPSTVLADPKPLFIDTFGDGNVEDADNLPNAWNVSTSRDASSIQESGGSLRFANEEPPVSVEVRTATIRTDVFPDYNFFEQPLVFEVDGLVYTSIPPSARESYFQMILVPIESASATQIPSGFAVRVRANNEVIVAAKQQDPTLTMFSEQYILNIDQVNSDITGFRLSINATDYRVVFKTASSGEVVLEGPHNLDPDLWGGDGVAIALQQQSGRVQSVDVVGRASIKQFAVYPAR